MLSGVAVADYRISADTMTIQHPRLPFRARPRERWVRMVSGFVTEPKQPAQPGRASLACSSTIALDDRRMIGKAPVESVKTCARSRDEKRLHRCAVSTNAPARVSALRS
jgi:hypothetical protein